MLLHDWLGKIFFHWPFSNVNTEKQSRDGQNGITLYENSFHSNMKQLSWNCYLEYWESISIEYWKSEAYWLTACIEK